MSTVTQRMSAEELIKLPSGRARYELIRGELQTMSPSGSEHGIVCANVAFILRKYVASSRTGSVFGAEAGFLLERDPDTVFAPDAAFVRSERRPPAGAPRGFWPGAPDLAVEVVSPNDSAKAVSRKVETWLVGGAQAVWVLDPHSKTLTVYRAGSPPLTLTEGDTIDGGDFLPGFAFPVSEFFWDL
jgi:Uma2 family endonuclease